MKTYRKNIINLFVFVAIIVLIVVGSVVTVWDSPKTEKPYPIEISYSYSSHIGSIAWGTMECDSVIEDTIYKDGLKIVNKNIDNIRFK